MKNTTEKKLTRGEFIRSLGLSTTTIMGLYCLGTTMTACGSDSPTPGNPGNPGNGNSPGVSGTTSGSSINFTVDLSNANYSSLKTNGDYKIIGDVLVARTTSGTYVALSKTCTHEGSALIFRGAQNNLFCSNHGSEFSTTGAVQVGPATTALKVYSATISSDGNTLTVKA